MSHPALAPLPFDVVLQSRGLGVIPALQELLPPWGVGAFAAATHLGDTAVLVALAALIYLAYDREAGAFVAGVLFCGFAVTLAAKAWFGLPRPPVELQYVSAYGLGFPSGHAVGSTVGWGAMALALDTVSSARRRAMVAGTVVAAVSISRVAIGVHYLVDVVAGVAVGLAVLWVAVRWLRNEPLGLFGLAGGLATLAVAISGAAVDSVALLGACIGAVTAWQVIEPSARPYGRHGVLASGIGSGLVVAGVAFVDPMLAAAFGGAALAAAGVIVAPVALERRLGR